MLEIYVVKSGDTPTSVAQTYGVSLNRLLADNGLRPTDALVVGQALVITFPETVHRVTVGESLFSIADRYGLSVRQLYRNNFQLGGRSSLVPGEELVIRYQNQGSGGTFVTNSYAYPYVEEALLRPQLPYLSYFTPFTYGIQQNGTLVDLDDAQLIALSKEYGTLPLMHLSTLTEEGGFSNQRASLVFQNEVIQEAIIEEILSVIRAKGYSGLDVDFEFIYPEERFDYVMFLQNLRLRLNSEGLPLFSALAPKTSDTQQGVLYEGHDYGGIGSAVNGVLMMTYEWGYTFGPPLAVAPLPNVRRVLEYGLTRVSKDKIFMGIPTYGYDWTLPYERGNPGAPSLSPVEAVDLARRFGAEIQYDERAQAPWFQYVNEEGQLHEVWFEDARSVEAKFALARELGLRGLGFWNSMREFPQNWVVLNQEYTIDDSPDFLE